MPEPRRRAAELADPTTPMQALASLLDARWRLLVAWSLFRGPRPFDDLMRQLSGITRERLLRELRAMETLGLVQRQARPEASREAEYALTPRGETLKPLLAALYEWGLFVLRSRAPVDSGSGPHPADAAIPDYDRTMAPA